MTATDLLLFYPHLLALGRDAPVGRYETVIEEHLSRCFGPGLGTHGDVVSRRPAAPTEPRRGP